METTVNTLDTSSAALKAVGVRNLAKQQQDILDVVIAAQRNGAADLSLTEIRDLYERTHGKRIDLNRVSARVSNLIAGGRLVRKEATRPCSISQRHIHPVCAPERQARLCA